MIKATCGVVLSLVMACMAAGCATRHVTTTASGQTVYGEQAKIIDRLRDAGADLEKLMGAPDSAVPQDVLSDAKCVAVVPDMVKGGFVFGATHGRGVATCRTPEGWSEPAFFVVSGGTWGAQIGLESVDLVMVIMNDKGMQQLLSSEFKLGGEAGVAAGPVGREAQASTDWKMKSEVLVYSRTRGLFAGLDLSGAVIKTDEDSMHSYYGKDVEPNLVLTNKGPKNPNSKLFLAEVHKAFAESRASR
ncbi:MAG TPA: lipid-binding SYLF domain-containing protein [Candidatus Angelobacter sp.]|nr:lipid-binding SYLF domain-containing protein [Candidatus Angelobacter sp.]